jgi:hypothetical protein
MFRWLRRSREETKHFAADVIRIPAKSTERGEPPSDMDPIEEHVRIVGEAPAPPRKSSEKAWPSERRHHGRR